jgi:hypothetical protein
LVEHDLFGKPVSTFPAHALTAFVLFRRLARSGRRALWTRQGSGLPLQGRPSARLLLQGRRIRSAAWRHYTRLLLRRPCARLLLLRRRGRAGLLLRRPRAGLLL